jgi:ABC-2 type transport system permease protein
MWLKYKASTVKETLLLMRDKAGLAMLFIMPMALILIMSMLQESTLKKLEERQTPILVINYDHDSLGAHIVAGLSETEFFELHQTIDRKPLDVQQLKNLVKDGEYRVGIVINEGASDALRNKIKYEIQQQFPEGEGALFSPPPDPGKPLPKIDVYFDPITQSAFKQAVMSALNEFFYAVEAKMVMEIYAGMMNDIVGIELRQAANFKNMIDLTEKSSVGKEEKLIIPNPAQHNVPAWTIFAMFFIVIPLAGNIIKERESGMSLRLRTLPGSNLAVILGKASVYFVVGMIQAASMLLVGMYILPLMGMPALSIGNSLPALFLVTLAISLAATGYGILIGTVSTTQEQSSIFGSISVVILAALGGIWVPVFMMSETMVKISRLSPLNWGLNAYYDIFLRNEPIAGILHYVLYLLAFALVCILAAWLYNRYKSVR